MSAAERAYRLLLRCYPRRFRTEFGAEMALLFRDQRLAAATSGESAAAFWRRIVWDLIRSAPRQRIDALRGADGSHFQPEGRVMKSLAIVSALVGVFEAFNASAEGWYGGIAARDGYALTAGALGTLAGLLLVVAGAALLRGARSAPSIVHSAAAGCLAAIVLAAVFAPRLSVLATLLGVVVPLLLLVFVRRDRAGAQLA